MNRSPIKMYIRDFVICYIILFFTSFAVEVNFKFSNLPTYIMPAIASLVAVLFFTRNAVWPVYKKGDKVWWSTYGEDHSAEHKPTSQKLILRFVSAFMSNMVDTTDSLR